MKNDQIDLSMYGPNWKPAADKEAKAEIANRENVLEFLAQREPFAEMQRTAAKRKVDPVVLTLCCLGFAGISVPHNVCIPAFDAFPDPVHLGTNLLVVGPPDSGKSRAINAAKKMIDLQKYETNSPLFDESPPKTGAALIDALLVKDQINDKPLEYEWRVALNRMIVQFDEILRLLNKLTGASTDEDYESLINSGFFGFSLGRTLAGGNKRHIPAGDYSLMIIMAMQDELAPKLLQLQASGCLARMLTVRSFSEPIDSLNAKTSDVKLELVKLGSPTMIEGRPFIFLPNCIEYENQIIGYCNDPEFSGLDHFGAKFAKLASQISLFTEPFGIDPWDVEAARMLMSLLKNDLSEVLYKVSNQKKLEQIERAANQDKQDVAINNKVWAETQQAILTALSEADGNRLRGSDLSRIFNSKARRKIKMDLLANGQEKNMWYVIKHEEGPNRGQIRWLMKESREVP